MPTTKTKTESNKGPSHNIIERLKMFMDAFIKQLKKTPVKPTPVKDTKPKVNPAAKRAAFKKKTTTARKATPKPKTGGT